MEQAQIPQLPELERPCKKCQGDGLYSCGGGGRERCDLCDGAGHVPTEYGEMVLRLIRHNLPAMIEAQR